jgi:arginine utilization protein RocB
MQKVMPKMNDCEEDRNMLIGARIKELALKLTAIQSVVGTDGEKRIAEEIYNYFSQIPYFQNHKKNLRLLSVPGDALGRCTVLAYVEGEKNDGADVERVQTVLCLGHIDTAGVDDYGELKEHAANTAALKEKLQSIALSEEVMAEINSPDWLVGRGIFDMKTGVAAQMVMLERFTEQVAQMKGNLVFIGVPDEEGSSVGMLSAVVELERLATEKKWEFVVAINTDYMTDRYPGDENKYIYIGTVGKLLPSFYVYGEETHVGEAFNGLDANLLASELLCNIDLNPKLCDVADNEVSLPPVSLRQRDLKQEYSVQTVNAVNLYFSYATHCSQPAEVLAKCKQQAIQSFDNTIQNLNVKYNEFCKMSNIKQQPLPWKVQVLTYEELYRAVKQEIGDKIDLLIEAAVLEQQDKQADGREISLAIVHEVHKNYSNQDSKIIVYFSPPYYPHMFVSGHTDAERNLLSIIEHVAKEAQSIYDYKIVTKKFYPYISDLSYCNLPKDTDHMEGMIANMPAWLRSYTLPIQAIQNISMPVVNIGPYGKDAHKLSERLHCDYSFDAMPFILEKAIAKFLL